MAMELESVYTVYTSYLCTIHRSLKKH